MNWNKIGWRALQVLVVLLMNVFGIAIIVMLFIESPNTPSVLLDVIKGLEGELDKQNAILFDLMAQRDLLSQNPNATLEQLQAINAQIEVAQKLAQEIQLEVFSLQSLTKSMFEDSTVLSVWGKGGLILGEVVGIMGSIGFIKFLYSQNRQDKRADKITKGIKENGAISKDISKYL